MTQQAEGRLAAVSGRPLVHVYFIPVSFFLYTAQIVNDRQNTSVDYRLWGRRRRIDIVIGKFRVEVLRRTKRYPHTGVSRLPWLAIASRPSIIRYTEFRGRRHCFSWQEPSGHWCSFLTRRSLGRHPLRQCRDTMRNSMNASFSNIAILRRYTSGKSYYRAGNHYPAK